MYEILVCNGTGLTARDDRLIIELDRKNNRKPHPSPEIEDRIEERWEDQLGKKGESVLWNATKFRLESAREAGDGRLHLMLGITDYREYQGTNLLTTEPLLVFQHERHLSNAFGNCCVVRTCDGKVPFLLRSRRVGEGEGFVVLPGGHAEPSRLGIESMGADISNTSPKKVISELFTSTVQEVVEEVGISRDHLHIDQMKMLGIVRRTADLKAQMVCVIDCDLSSIDVNQLPQLEPECQQLLFADFADLASVSDTGRLMGIKLMPEHVGAVALYLRFQESVHECKRT
uniref:Nudix hydrolase domain-containing protein n=1 Tax=Rhodosorus marinus TaxID=101924 RepID=A0A7S2ZHZ3_9RHOD|mmetsp:Transcript_19139/g.76693  ORF Transcript_19139/g.76693 Transcript_19139/m.76693 type:complete len:287 (+) Transcript_19139:195-1055(+)